MGQSCSQPLEKLKRFAQGSITKTKRVMHVTRAICQQIHGMDHVADSSDSDIVWAGLLWANRQMAQ